MKLSILALTTLMTFGILTPVKAESREFIRHYNGSGRVVIPAHRRGNFKHNGRQVRFRRSRSRFANFRRHRGGRNFSRFRRGRRPVRVYRPYYRY